MKTEQRDPREHITDLLVAQIAPGMMKQVRKNIASLVNELWQEKDAQWKEMITQQVLQPRQELAQELTETFSQQIIAKIQGGQK
jgi:hypothetical protein